jgi:hypothetical protein
MPLAQCPKELPPDLLHPIELLAKAWAISPQRPHPSQEVLARWDEIIKAWAEADDIPLLVRKANGNRGHALKHASGRTVVPVDNSSAQWVFRCAADAVVWELDEVRSRLREIPVAQAQDSRSGEKANAVYTCCNSRKNGVSGLGWRLAHIEPVGLRAQWEVCSLQNLKDHFKLLMSPSNMFVVPSSVGGLAEVPAVIGSVRRFLLDK